MTSHSPSATSVATSPTTTPAISCRDLCITFGDNVVLDHLDLTVRPGKVHAFLGRNGSGKSTTIRILLGLTTPDSGTVELFGAPLRRETLNRVGASVDGPALYGHLSAWDNMAVHARLLCCSATRVDHVLDQVGLAGAGRKRSRTFSTGMKMRLALGIALLGEPEVLILDEPQNGLDPEGIVELRHLLRDWAARGGTVLVSSHQLGEVARLADDITVLADGRAQYSGQLGDFAPRGELEEKFLQLTLPVDNIRTDGGAK